MYAHVPVYWAHPVQGRRRECPRGTGNWGVEWYPRARNQVALFLPHGHTTEVPQDHVVVGVLPVVSSM